MLIHYAPAYLKTFEMGRGIFVIRFVLDIKIAKYLVSKQTQYNYLTTTYRQDTQECGNYHLLLQRSEIEFKKLNLNQPFFGLFCFSLGLGYFSWYSFYLLNNSR